MYISLLILLAGEGEERPLGDASFVNLSISTHLCFPSVYLLSLFVCVRLSVSGDGVGIFLKRLRGGGQARRSGLPRLCTLVSQNPH